MKQFAILGYPLGHSLSPQLHKMLAEELGEELSYHVFEISPEEFDQKKAELSSLKEAAARTIMTLEKEYSENHETLAAGILKQMIEG